MPMPYSVKLLKRLVPISNSRINQIHEGRIRQSRKKKRIEGRSRGPALYHTERETENYSGILEPSVAQPPLPLQEFLPLQPLSLDLQRPFASHEFLPLQ